MRMYLSVCPFLDAGKLKMALRAFKVYGAFEKRTPGLSVQLHPLLL